MGMIDPEAIEFFSFAINGLYNKEKVYRRMIIEFLKQDKFLITFAVERLKEGKLVSLGTMLFDFTPVVQAGPLTSCLSDLDQGLLSRFPERIFPSPALPPEVEGCWHNPRFSVLFRVRYARSAETPWTLHIKVEPAPQTP